MKLDEKQLSLLLDTAKIHGYSPEQLSAMLRGMAVVVTEYEVMKARLIELKEVYDETPTRWQSNGEPLVKNIEETIKKFREKNE